MTNVFNSSSVELQDLHVIVLKESSFEYIYISKLWQVQIKLQNKWLQGK